jgi:hypothetical protein
VNDGVELKFWSQLYEVWFSLFFWNIQYKF